MLWGIYFFVKNIFGNNSIFDSDDIFLSIITFHSVSKTANRKRSHQGKYIRGLNKQKSFILKQKKDMEQFPWIDSNS